MFPVTAHRRLAEKGQLERLEDGPIWSRVQLRCHSGALLLVLACGLTDERYRSVSRDGPTSVCERPPACLLRPTGTSTCTASFAAAVPNETSSLLGMPSPQRQPK